MADMKLQADPAAKWVGEVQTETKEVEKLLKQVTDECSTFPGSNDTIFKLIEKTGNMLNDTWTAATNAYKDAWEKVGEGIDTVIQKGKKVEESFDSYIAKHR